MVVYLIEVLLCDLLHLLFVDVEEVRRIRQRLQLVPLRVRQELGRL